MEYQYLGIIDMCYVNLVNIMEHINNIMVHQTHRVNIIKYLYHPILKPSTVFVLFFYYFFLMATIISHVRVVYRY